MAQRTRAEHDFVSMLYAYGQGNPAEAIRVITPTQTALGGSVFRPAFLQNESLYALLSEMADKDTTISAALATMEASVSAQEWGVFAGDDSPAAQDAHTLCLRVIEKLEKKPVFGLSSAMSAFIRGPILFGFSVAEVLWDLSGNEWTPSAIVPRHNGQFAYDSLGNLLLLAPGGRGQATPEAREDLRFRFLSAQRPSLLGNPFGDSAVFPLRFIFEFKREVFKSFARFVRTMGVPLIIAEIPAGASADVKRLHAEVTAALSSARDGDGLIIPQGVMIRTEQRGATANVPHIEFLKIADQWETRHLLGSTLPTTQSENGSLAQAYVQKTVADDRLIPVLRSVETAFNQLFRFITDVNFGEGVPSPTFQYSLGAEMNASDLFTLAEKVANAGIPVSLPALMEKLQVAPPAEGDELFISPQILTIDEVRAKFGLGPLDSELGERLVTRPYVLSRSAASSNLFGAAGADEGDGEEAGEEPEPTPEEEGMERAEEAEEDAAFSFAERQRKEEIREVYGEWRMRVNMSVAQMEAWRQTPCAKAGRFSASPCYRHIHLCTTPVKDWGKREVTYAKRAIRMIDRKLGEKPGAVMGSCPSKRDLVLLNWGHRPKTVKAMPKAKPAEFSESARAIRFAEASASERRYAKVIDGIAKRLTEVNLPTVGKFFSKAISKLARAFPSEGQVPKEAAGKFSLNLPALKAELAEGIAAARIAAADSIFRAVSGFIDSPAVDKEALAPAYRNGLSWMQERKLMSRDELQSAAQAIAAFGGTDAKRVEREIRREVLALAKAPNEVITQRARDLVTAAVDKGVTKADFLEAMDGALTGEHGMADAYLNTVFRTETAAIYSEERDQVRDDEAVSDLLWGREMMNPDDERSRPSHAALEGLKLEFGGEADEALGPGGPFSYNCRCTWVPVLKGDEGDGEPARALSLVEEVERFSESGCRCGAAHPVPELLRTKPFQRSIHSHAHHAD